MEVTSVITPPVKVSLVLFTVVIMPAINVVLLVIQAVTLPIKAVARATN